MIDLPTLQQTRIIGLGNRARQGKDHAARVLQRSAPGDQTRRFGFADALYSHCRIMWHMRAKNPILLQDVGLAMREIDPDTWVNALLWTIQAWDAEARGPQVALICDVRFPNEAEAITALGGHLVRIERYTATGRWRATDRPADHPSETALDDYPWPHTIENFDGELEGFEALVQIMGSQLVPEVFKASPVHLLASLYGDSVADSPSSEPH